MQMALLRCKYALTTIVLVVSANAYVQADVRKAVQRALPATVAVEWRSSSDDGPEGNAAQLNQTAERLALTADGRRLLADVTTAAVDTPDQVALSSGTVLSPDGLIATCISEMSGGEFSVAFEDGRRLPAKLAVKDRRSGLLLLKVDAENLGHAELAEKDAELGEPVVTTFCTDLKQREVARGIVSARNRTVSGWPVELLQTDLAAGKMSAGAPVVNENGELLGIIVAQDTDAATRGVTFAVPAKHVQALLNARDAERAVVIQRGYLGISLGGEGGKVLATDVLAESPADLAGIRTGDVIVAVDGDAVSEPADVVKRIQRKQAGTTITVKVRRADEEHEFEVTLDALPRQLRSTRVESVKRGKVTIFTPEGKPVVIDVQTGEVESGDASNLPALEAWKKAQEVWKGRTVLQRSYEEALKSYQQALKRFPQATTPTIRVQRTELDKKLDRLSTDVELLRKQIEQLTEQLKRLDERLEKIGDR